MRYPFCLLFPMKRTFFFWRFQSDSFDQATAFVGDRFCWWLMNQLNVLVLLVSSSERNGEGWQLGRQNLIKKLSSFATALVEKVSPTFQEIVKTSLNSQEILQNVVNLLKINQKLQNNQNLEWNNLKIRAKIKNLLYFFKTKLLQVF